MSPLLDKRLIFVTGKGGVGKSTVAVALGLAAARRGKRTIVAEVAGQNRVAAAFGRPDVGFEEVELSDGLWAISIDPRNAMEEYIALQVKIKALGDVLSHSRMFQYFAAATPGLAEVVTVGKVSELAQLERKTKGGSRYDLVIVDAPATGHGLALMRSPKTFANVARVGPVASQGNRMHSMLTDDDFTGVLAVATPEDMPVNETLTLRDSLEQSMGIDLDLVVANAVYPRRFEASEAQELRAADEDLDGEAAARAAIRAALSEHARELGQREQLERLRAEVGSEVVELPFVFASALESSDYEALSERLEEAL